MIDHTRDFIFFISRSYFFFAQPVKMSSITSLIFRNIPRHNNPCHTRLHQAARDARAVSDRVKIFDRRFKILIHRQLRGIEFTSTP